MSPPGTPNGVRFRRHRQISYGLAPDEATLGTVDHARLERSTSRKAAQMLIKAGRQVWMQ